MWSYNYNTPSDELYHYGVKGMKWGVRKAARKETYGLRKERNKARKEYNISRNKSSRYKRRNFITTHISKKKKQELNKRLEDTYNKKEVYNKADKKYKSAYKKAESKAETNRQLNKQLKKNKRNEKIKKVKDLTIEYANQSYERNKKISETYLDMQSKRSLLDVMFIDNDVYKKAARYVHDFNMDQDNAISKALEENYKDKLNNRKNKK